MLDRIFFALTAGWIISGVLAGVMIGLRFETNYQPFAVAISATMGALAGALATAVLIAWATRIVDRPVTHPSSTFMCSDGLKSNTFENLAFFRTGEDESAPSEVKG